MKSKIKELKTGTYNNISIGDVYRLPGGRFLFKVLQIDLCFSKLKRGKKTVFRVKEKEIIWLQAYDSNVKCGNVGFLSPFPTFINNRLFKSENKLYDEKEGELKYL